LLDVGFVNVNSNKIKKISVSNLDNLRSLSLASNPVTKLTLNKESLLSDLDIRSTKIKTLDLRRMSVELVQARGTKIKIMTSDPLADRLKWQQYNDAGVRITSK
jgi:Leucine-rich repeat (LRR) protein